jgi:histidinol phosphatase-like enzyme
MSEVVLIDFDGTVVEHCFPRIGEPLPGAFEVLKELKEAGYKLILWTCREDFGHNINQQYLKEAIEFCRENGVEFDAVNETLEEYDFRPEKCIKRKPHAHWCIDDRNLGGFPGWDVVREVLIEGKSVTWGTHKKKSRA